MEIYAFDVRLFKPISISGHEMLPTKFPMKFHSVCCQFREEALLPSWKKFSPDNIWYNRKGKNMKELNLESMVDMELFWWNSIHKIFGVSECSRVLHCLHEQQVATALILDKFDNLLQNMFRIIVYIEYLSFGKASSTWKPPEFHTIMIIIFSPNHMLFSFRGFFTVR
jgi:hypothetical protein